MGKIKLEVRGGSKINASTIGKIDAIWKNAFSVTYQVSKDYREDIFFLLCKDNEILSVARLRKRHIIFRDKMHQVFGIADMVSVIKGKGYGRRVMGGIKKYLLKNNEIGLGFCRRENGGFYKKSGYFIGKNQVKRFEFRDGNGKIVRDKFDIDVIYSDLGKKLQSQIFKFSNEQVYCLTNPW